MESRQFPREGWLCCKEGFVQCHDRLLETQEKHGRACFHVAVSNRFLLAAAALAALAADATSSVLE